MVITYKKIILILLKEEFDMKPFKRHNKRLLIMIAMSITCACASTAYAEINERPGPDATYDDKVVLDSEWQIYNNEYAGAEKRNVGL